MGNIYPFDTNEYLLNIVCNCDSGVCCSDFANVICGFLVVGGCVVVVVVVTVSSKLFLT